VKVSAVLVVPTCWLPKFHDAGVRDTGTTPVPVRPLAFELTAKPSEPELAFTVTVADLLPADVGLKATVNVQEFPAVIVLPAHRLEAEGTVNWLGLAPPSATFETRMLPVPVLV
jgi:hypothetical protein